MAGKWDLVEKAWISGLVQSGTLLRWQGQPHFVLRAYEQGLLVVEEFARLRVAEIGNRIEKILSEGQLDKLTESDFAIFQLEAHQPEEAASASKQHSAVLKCSLLGEA